MNNEQKKIERLINRQTELLAERHKKACEDDDAEVAGKMLDAILHAGLVFDEEPWPLETKETKS